jgi:glycerophosphoryl diester phosphodiesterase
MAAPAANPASPVSLWREGLTRLRKTWQSMLALHVAFILLGIAVFAPLVGVTSRLLLGLSGEPAVADQDIARFLLSPAGLAALIVFAALLIGIVAFEQAAMMRVAMGHSRGETVRVIDAVHFTVSRAHALFLFAAHLVARLLLIVFPFLAIGAVIAVWLITDYDINYYLTEKPQEFILAAILIAVVLTVMALLLVQKLVGWSLALPLVIFNAMAPNRSFAESRRLMIGYRSSVFRSFCLWALMTLLLGAVVLGIVRFVGGAVVPVVADDLSRLLVVLGLLAGLLAGCNFLVTAATSAHFAALLTVLHEVRTATAGMVPSVAALEGQRHTILTPARLAIGLLIAAGVAVLSSAWLVDDIRTEDDVLIVAHRGAAGRAPENTMASVKAALEDRADWVEIDVQETSDGEVVVVHDSDFMKLAGDATKVWDATLAQLGEIDIGSWFGAEFAAERVPTLRDVLEAARGKARVVVELKYYGHDQKLESRVADIVEQAGMTDSVAIMSLKYEAVQKMKSLRPDWTVGLLSATAIGDLSRLNADFLAVSTNMASAGFVRRAQEAGKQVFVWTVNDPVTMSQVISQGVDGIITDEPAMARRVLAERAGMNTGERLLIYAAIFFGSDFVAREYRDTAP